jgi:hypothetical protein
MLARQQEQFAWIGGVLPDSDGPIEAVARKNRRKVLGRMLGCERLECVDAQELTCPSWE